jgi:hypothetical protein
VKKMDNDDGKSAQRFVRELLWRIADDLARESFELVATSHLMAAEAAAMREASDALLRR